MVTRMIVALAFVVLTVPAFAGSCPTLISDIDRALEDSATTTSLSESELERVRTLRDEGERLHKSGDHGESVAKLRKAMSMLPDSDGSFYSN